MSSRESRAGKQDRPGTHFSNAGHSASVFGFEFGVPRGLPSSSWATAPDPQKASPLLLMGEGPEGGC